MTTIRYDFHCHSTASDGALTPSELIHRAHQQGVNILSLTDHDCTDGLKEASDTAKQTGIKLIPGVEISTTWNNKCLHIIGLNINPDHSPLHEGLINLQHIRVQRAKKIAEKLAKKRIPDAYEAVRERAGKGMITRTHFADFLLHEGYVTTKQEAFNHYLSKGKPGFVHTEWVELEHALSWITDSGGIAILAHPFRYKLTASWIRHLLTDFKAKGGQALEVVTGQSTPEEIRLAADYAERFELAGSVGSDFHSPDNPWVELGRLQPLPEKTRPIWELLD